jgi:hypothetical protein
MAVHFSLITASTRLSSSSMVRCTAIEKRGSTSRSFSPLSGVRSPGWGDPMSMTPIGAPW